jgi:hypothetical protein
MIVCASSSTYFVPSLVRGLHKGDVVLWNGTSYQVDSVTPAPPGATGTVILLILDRGHLARSNWKGQRPRTSIRFSHDDMLYVLTKALGVHLALIQRRP